VLVVLSSAGLSLVVVEVVLVVVTCFTSPSALTSDPSACAEVLEVETETEAAEGSVVVVVVVAVEDTLPLAVVAGSVWVETVVVVV